MEEGGIDPSTLHGVFSNLSRALSESSLDEKLSRTAEQLAGRVK